MEHAAPISIIAVDFLSAGLVVKFDDGRCAFYSAEMLSALFAEAEEIDETEIVW